MATGKNISLYRVDFLLRNVRLYFTMTANVNITTLADKIALRLSPR